MGRPNNLRQGAFPLSAQFTLRIHSAALDVPALVISDGGTITPRRLALVTSETAIACAVLHCSSQIEPRAGYGRERMNITGNQATPSPVAQQTMRTCCNWLISGHFLDPMDT
jgi:hypothetical protein